MVQLHNGILYSYKKGIWYLLWSDIYGEMLTQKKQDANSVYSMLFTSCTVIQIYTYTLAYVHI